MIEQADIDAVRELSAIAVATQPGLPGSLLVGLAAAKGLCVAWQKPLIAINHVQAHIYACQLTRAESIYPCVGFVVSGGHTNLYRCHSADDWKYLGGTIDDAVGEAFDKVAVMLGLPYPGGPHISRLAAAGDPQKYSLPRPMLADRSTLNLSFSGLKTAVRYHLVGSGKQDFSTLSLSLAAATGHGGQLSTGRSRLCGGQSRIGHASHRDSRRLCVGGGVAANSLLRQQFASMAAGLGVELLIAPAELCTDNAVMGAIAWEQFDRGQFAPLDIDIHAGLFAVLSLRRPKFSTVAPDK